MTPAPAIPVKLGDSITYSAVLRRTWVEPKDIATWLPVAVPPMRGVVVGRRTLSIGRVNHVTDTDEWSGRSYTIREWERLGSVPAILVAYDLIHVPIYVPPEAVWYLAPDLVARILRQRLTAGAAP